MASVVFYFQVHQPFRLRPYTIFDAGAGYFDDARNMEILNKVSEKCYLPANEAILELIEQFDGKFRVSYSLTGTVIEQFQKWRPDVLKSFQALAETGCVEFIAETYYHSLVFLYNREEFISQTRRHHRLIADLFGQEPKVFRNTELTYNNDVARVVGDLGYETVLTEGADHILGYRSPNFLYHPPNCKELHILLKNYRLSDDIAFRFSNQSWSEWPLTAEKFTAWVNRINGNGYVCNLFMDYETFGEHQWQHTGIFDFLRTLPGLILEGGKNDFLTISQAVDRYPSAGEMDVPHMISWADTERDISAWLGNSMQANALHDINEMAADVLASGDEELIHDWGRLQSSDHFYYMCTKWFDDGDVHKYFNPYESPYEAYINYMNILDSVRARTKPTNEHV
ncbi:MAG: glycoside hydrolase family 57 protein [Phycisphaerae bacterium]|jgi:alpha-amylase|nr:glycoside hydrolase family 57 protein [Phycisphaerae bacterium]